MFPITWAHFGSRISARVASWKSRVATRVKYAGLTRTHAVVIQCLLALSMWLHSGLASQMTIILVFTIAARCQLHPQEVRGKLKGSASVDRL